MTNREMQNDFEYKLNQHDSDLMVDSETIFHWLNVAYNREVVTTYTGNNPKRQSFEETQKRIDDLRSLVKEESLPTIIGFAGVDKPNSYTATLPNDYMFAVGEESTIQFTSVDGLSTIIKRQPITEITSDMYTKKINDPYSEHVLHYETAKPLRLFKTNYVELVSDGNYQIPYYHLRYIKMPITLTLDGAECELPEHMHSEVVDRAVNLYLEATGNPRYQTNKGELINNE